MIEQAAKVLIGTAFYVGIVWVAQRNPRAAGMMLTFPTLNGLVLLMAGRPALEDAASAMLLMPPINAAMWAFYFAGFDRLADERMSAAVASGVLMGIGCAGWFAVVAAITQGQWGVPTPWQWAYLAAVIVAGGVLTLALPRTAAGAPPGTTVEPLPLAALLVRYRGRIAVFALTLAAIAMIDRLGASPAMLGAVAGAPLVAMFGMQMIATDGTSPPAVRRASFAAMSEGLWLGPGIAIVFVAGYWRALAALQPLATGLAYDVAAIFLLLAGWALCILTIWTVSSMLQRHPAATPPRRMP